MATLIPEMSISEFKKLKVYELKELNSCEVYSDGMYLFTFLNTMLEPSGSIRAEAEYMAQMSNSVSGKSIEEIRNYAPV